MDTDKLTQVEGIIRSLGKVAVAYSGGVDSTLLLYIAHQQSGSDCLAVTADSCLFPHRELLQAKEFCAQHRIDHLIVTHDALAVQGICTNPPDRCYHCKKDLFTRIQALANSRGINHVIDGTNADDTSDYRPGLKALHELGVVSPFMEAGVTKDEIYALSSLYKLPTARKKSFACLATRIPYGEAITIQKLRRIDMAEQFLLDEGLTQVRVRSHGDLARIETDKAGMAALAKEDMRARVHQAFIKMGFSYVSLDLLEYKSGSMNINL